MKKMQCIKCGSGNTYRQDGENACMMCGSRWPIVLKQPPMDMADEYSRSEEKETMEEKETVKKEDPPVKNDKRKACRNCERMMTIPGDGLCGGCYGAVKGKSKGTPEYDAALAQAKIKLTDPNFKPGNNRRNYKAKHKSLPPPSKKSSVSDTLTPQPSNDANPTNIEKASLITAAIEFLKTEMLKNDQKQTKLSQAIQILSEL